MRKTMGTVLGLVLIAGFVSSCGSSDKSSSSGDNGNTTTTQPDNSGSGGSSNEFSDLLAKADSANIRIVYQREGEDSFTYAQDGNGKSAFTQGETTLYTDGDTTVSCKGTGSDAECTKLPLGGLAASALGQVTKVFSGLTKLSSSALGGDVTSDTIAGRDAKCVTFSASNLLSLAALSGSLDGEATICIDEETGFLLKLETSKGSETKDLFVATEVGEATEADLTPPVTPSTISLPDIPGLSIPG